MKKFDYEFRYSAVSLIAVFLLLLSCSSSSSTMPMPSNTGGGGGGGGSNPPTGEVWIQNFAFNPATLTVAVNTTVKWTNKDATSHTVTSDAGLFDSGGLSTNGIYNFKFTQVGTFNYHCSIHPEMTAKIIVQ